MNRPRMSFRPAGRSPVSRALRASGLAAALVVGGLAGTGCVQKVEAPVAQQRHADLPAAADLPDFMEGTIHEKSAIGNTMPANVSSYGLVGQLRGTGDSTASNVVRQYMIKEMARRGFGDALMPGFERINPGDVLRDPNYAIVRVDAFIPPGARRDDFIDAQVTCLPNNRTTSLGRGILFETDLKEYGADVENPSGAVNVLVRVKGPIVVNPAYALDNPGKADAQARASLRQGTVMFNARVMQDRPLLLQLRQPQWSMSRTLESIIDYRFQDPEVAKAYDEGIVELYVPRSYRGDWQRFAEVVRHLYVHNSPEFNARKSRQLAELAQQPGARLEDISYCWEGIGNHALPFIKPLLNHSDQSVAFYAARAAAFIGDDTGAAEQRLMQMARVANHPFQMTAIRTLGTLPKSHSLNSMLRELLVSDQAQIRIEAYTILARNGDSSIISTPVAPAGNPNDQRFLLDRVPCDAPPMIYVTRTGKPRIALMGRIPDLSLPVPFTTMDQRLTIAVQNRNQVKLFFRDPLRERPVSVDSQPDLDTIIARLGGMGADQSDTLNFSYGEVAAILQRMADTGRLLARGSTGALVRTAFLLQEPARLREDLAAAGLIASGALIDQAPQFGPPAEYKPEQPGAQAAPGAAPQPASLAPTPVRPEPAAPLPPFGPAPTAIAPAPTPQPQPGPVPPAAGAGESNAPKF